MKFFGIDQIEEEIQSKIKNTLVSAGQSCVVYSIAYEDIKKSLEGQTISQACETNLSIRELYSRVNKCKKISSLNGLKYVRNIGRGGFGTVLLTRDT